MNSVEAVDDSKRLFYCPHCKGTLVITGKCYICRSCVRSYPVVDAIPLFADQQMYIDSFDVSAFAFLFEMEQKHFWHIGRRELIFDMLRRSISGLFRFDMLEIGCGNGSILAYLKQKGVNIEGGDIFLEGLKFCRRRTTSINLYQFDVTALPFKNNLDLIGLFDVLEHIDDDVKALSEINSALKSDGYLILTVPAYQYLWSDFDEISYHKRRYGKHDIVDKLNTAGFKIRRYTYFMFFLFPLLAFIRLVRRANPKSNNSARVSNKTLELRTIPVINGIFLALLRFEKYLIRYISLPFGSSILILAQKDSRNEN